MLYRKRLAILLIPAVFRLGACSTQDLKSDTDGTVAATDDARHVRHLQELTSDHSEQLSRRNGIESEPGRHQPEVTPIRTDARASRIIPGLANIAA